MRRLFNYLDDICLIAGCAAILYGLSMWNEIATWIAAGVMLIGFGVLIGKARSHASK